MNKKGPGKLLVWPGNLPTYIPQKLYGERRSIENTIFGKQLDSSWKIKVIEGIMILYLTNNEAKAACIILHGYLTLILEKL